MHCHLFDETISETLNYRFESKTVTQSLIYWLVLFRGEKDMG